MTYTVPQVVVFQQFEEAAEAATVVRLPACIIGPQYKPFRYAEADEKLLASIGTYNKTAGNTSTWPNKPAGSVVDQDWTKLYFDNAWHEYFRDLSGSTYGITGYVDDSGNPYYNRIRCDSLVFKTYGSWARTAAAFRTRDVQVGDGVIVRATVDSTDYEIYTYVTGLVHDTVDAVVDAGEEDTNNVSDSTQSETATQTAGDTGTVSVAADGSSYDGAEDGDITESYTLTVETAGDFGTAQLSVVSASGNDTPGDNIVPTDGAAVAVGTRGLTVTFSSTGSATPFVAGQVWRIDVAQTWTAATIEAAGTYVGTSDGTYVIEVTTGGAWTDSPQVFVTSTGTLEASGPFEVSFDTYVTTPNGMKFKFGNAGATGLAAGDKYYVDVTAQGLGAVKTLQLRNSLPAALYGDGSVSPATLDVSLSIVKNVQISETYTGSLTNWSTSATQITVEAGIVGTDSTWVNNLGVQLEMPIIKADMYVEYRALLRDHVSAVGSVSTVSEALAALGDNSTDNPLCYAVVKAVMNGGGQPVYYIATDGDETDIDAFSDALELITDNPNTYGLVPLTHNSVVQQLVVAHVNSLSVAEKGKWRVCWLGAQATAQTAVATEDSDGNMLMATVSDDPSTTGTQYTLVECDDANFITQGVLAGHTLRVNYYTDPSTGVEHYTEATIDTVLSEEQLLLSTGLTAEVSVATRIEVWKTNTTAELAQQVATFAGSFANKRVRVVWPDVITDSSGAVDNIYLCAALAGLRGGTYPHQGLTNVEISGFTSVPRTTELFGATNLNTMAESGVWIVTQDSTGTIYTRHQLTTTSSTSVDFREDSMVSNVDSVSYYYLNFFTDARYIGRRNITPALLTQLEADFDGATAALIYATQDTTIGEQILSANLTTLQRHATLRDRVQATLEVDFPEPLNNLDITLISLAQ